jgi:hypothetical protein
MCPSLLKDYGLDDGLATQLCFRCDVSEAGPLVSEDDLAEDFLSFITLIIVKKPVSESITDRGFAEWTGLATNLF